MSILIGPGKEPTVIGPSGGYTSPEGEFFTEPWYAEAGEPPRRRVPVNRAGELILQVEQLDVPDGKRTCHLTSQLNMWILRGQITSKEAQIIQDELVFESGLNGCWSDGAGNVPGGGLVWHGSPFYTSYYVNRIVGKKVSWDEISFQEDLQLKKLLECLDSGYIATIKDGYHARVVFKPREFLKYFVFDPLHKIQTGLYTPERIVGLQKSSSPFYIA